MTIEYGAARTDYSVIRWFETEAERDTFLAGFPECIGITGDFSKDGLTETINI